MPSSDECQTCKDEEEKLLADNQDNAGRAAEEKVGWLWNTIRVWSDHNVVFCFSEIIFQYHPQKPTSNGCHGGRHG